MLGFRPLARTLEAALRDVSSKKPEVRADAIRDLMRHSDDARPQVVRALEGALRDEDPRIRGLAANALSDMDGGEALAALLVAVEDDDSFVRQMAISALGQIGDPRAGERLRRALSDARPEVRFQAVMAYPRVVARKDDALEAVLKATEDDDALVVHIALRMAEELAGDAPPAERSMKRAKALLDHEDVSVRVAAAILLAHGGDLAGRSLLAKVASGELQTKETEDDAAAIELAGKLQLKEAEAGLTKRAFGGILGFGRDKHQWHARVALAAMGNERAVNDILEGLRSRDPERRSLSVAAAGQARLAAARDALIAMRDAPSRVDPEIVSEALRALDRKPAR